MNTSAALSRNGKGVCAIIALGLLGTTLVAVGVYQRLRSASAADGLTVTPANLTLRAEDGSGPTREAEFVIRNGESIPVRILDIATSCDCMLTDPLQKSVLRPGEEIALYARVSLPATGARTSTIRILSDSASNPQAVVSLTLIGKPLEVPSVLEQPRQMVLLINPGAEVTSQRFVVKTLEAADQDPWLSGLVAVDQDIDAQIVDTSIEREFHGADAVWRNYVFEVTAVNRIPDETVRTTEMFLKERVSGLGEFAPISVRIESARALESRPSTLVFHFANGAVVPSDATINLVGNSDDAWNVVRISTDPSWLIAEVAPQSEAEAGGSTSHILRATVSSVPSSSDEADRELVRALIQVSTDHPLQEDVQIPVLLQRD